MKTSAATSRREFLKTSLLCGFSCATAGCLSRRALAAEPAPAATPSRVALTTGDDRADNIFRGLEPFGRQIALAIGNRRVLIKPNNVSIDRQLASTHADCLEGILEFLKSIGKLDNVVIAESAGMGSTMEGFANFGYPRLAAKYGTKLIDFDQQKSRTIHVFNQKDFRPHAARISPLLLDRDNYIISAAKIKTHDQVVATLSLKNIVFGAPVKDPGFSWGKGCKPGTKTDKPICHGGGMYGINYNLFALSERLWLIRKVLQHQTWLSAFSYQLSAAENSAFLRGFGLIADR